MVLAPEAECLQHADAQRVGLLLRVLGVDGWLMMGVVVCA